MNIEIAKKSISINLKNIEENIELIKKSLNRDQLLSINCHTNNIIGHCNIIKNYVDLTIEEYL